MNNLHRELAPVSTEAWEQIEEEATRTLKRYLGARRMVDVQGPNGFDFSSVGTGHTVKGSSFCEGLEVSRRDVKPLLELRVPFQLTRAAIDDVARGSNDSDWQPLKNAAKTIAFAEDHVVFEGYREASIEGMLHTSSNPAMALPDNLDNYPEVIAAAVNQLRLVGVNGPYALLLGAEPYTALTGGSEDGYPLLKHIQRLVDKEIVWSPAIKGGAVMTTRGGDFDLYLGQDISIGYLSHSAEEVTLYLQETLTYMTQTSEAAVILTTGT
ncbi:Linocin-M18 [Methyloligella halotolerans]|uniref:Linocin-M18 n=1 Tax=Methyloligella halotolerans TaxID=1177755 RepID=A0A1E2RUZ8_9HYPH|nr:family 1 encapsulin nanocompartment shell protein [Methyloligella halotolerans]ODA66031.1 Linocin-M18 [Methyloligella halotolerans]